MSVEKFVGLVAVVLSLATAHADGHTVGNGGDGVVIGGQTYLFDLVESGLETSPFFDPAVTPLRDFVRRVTSAVGHLDIDVNLLAQKLTEIDRYDLLLSRVLLEAMAAYDFGIVDFPLKDLPDDGDTVVNLPATYRMVQLAVRTGRRISISRDAWNALNAANKVALIFHEMNYALVSTGLSRDARALTAYLFGPTLAARGRKGLVSQTRTLVPTLQFETRLMRVVGGVEHVGPAILFRRLGANSEVIAGAAIVGEMSDSDVASRIGFACTNGLSDGAEIVFRDQRVELAFSADGRLQLAPGRSIDLGSSRYVAADPNSCRNTSAYYVNTGRSYFSDYFSAP